MGIKLYMEPKGHSKCLHVLSCRHLLSSGMLELTWMNTVTPLEMTPECLGHKHYDVLIASQKLKGRSN